MRSNTRFFCLTAALIAALSLGLAGCETVWPSRSPDETPVAVAAETPAPQVASGRKNQPRRPPDIKLDAGCPLGSEAVLGLNLAEKDCNAHPHTNPRGPVGIPATP
ncbi:MAG TPA: hypothetical protein VN632_07670 [Stellaceae bacterium]|nr:hypothetical protein [Stellaceae bacterium]